MDEDELQWRKKKTLVERDHSGSGRWGGPPTRTAVGAEGFGFRSDGTAFCKRVAIHHSDPAVTFALQILLEPLVREGSIVLCDVAHINLDTRWFELSPIQFDVIIAEVTYANIGLFFGPDAKSYPNRVIVVGSTPLISEYLIRLTLRSISCCPIRFGLEPVLYCTREYFRQPNRNLVVHDLVEEHFFVQPVGRMSARQRNLLRRLNWPADILLSEFRARSDELALEIQELLLYLDADCIEDAIGRGDSFGITQLTLDPDLAEIATFDTSVQKTVSDWLSLKLSSIK